MFLFCDCNIKETLNHAPSEEIAPSGECNTQFDGTNAERSLPAKPRLSVG